MVKKAHCYDRGIEKAEPQTVIIVQCSPEGPLSLKLHKSMFMTTIKKKRQDRKNPQPGSSTKSDKNKSNLVQYNLNYPHIHCFCCKWSCSLVTQHKKGTAFFYQQQYWPNLETYHKDKDNKLCYIASSYIKWDVFIQRFEYNEIQFSSWSLHESMSLCILF